jgi:hypothetical protein
MPFWWVSRLFGKEPKLLRDAATSPRRPLSECSYPSTVYVPPSPCTQPAAAEGAAAPPQSAFRPVGPGPDCPSCNKVMRWSNYAELDYEQGWHCVNFRWCGVSTQLGASRYFCKSCAYDLCLYCGAATMSPRTRAHHQRGPGEVQADTNSNPPHRTHGLASAVLHPPRPPNLLGMEGSAADLPQPLSPSSSYLERWEESMWEEAYRERQAVYGRTADVGLENDPIATLRSSATSTSTRYGTPRPPRRSRSPRSSLRTITCDNGWTYECWCQRGAPASLCRCHAHGSFF